MVRDHAFDLLVTLPERVIEKPSAQNMFDVGKESHDAPSK